MILSLCQYLNDLCYIIEISISQKINQLEENTTDLPTIYASIQDIINCNNNTKAKLIDLQNRLNEIIDAQQEVHNSEVLGGVLPEYREFGEVI
ncbi:hypothetical protein [Rickettsia endosymbiont of Gonocerus acuteangulatus]|uniref:hypothetical protein n=1 Tax=Rickettsia endosymbiont of Gonocerus acuteangulatus TaxID=3066266 RepID=UPI003132C4A1